MGVPFKFCVEETEYDKYCASLGEDCVLRMPFHDLGRRSVPARNWAWQHAREHGHARHWCIDDNIRHFARCHNNRRIIVKTAAVLAAIEDFVDRYENVALAGPHERGFIMDRDPHLTPILLNSRIYSCILVKTDLPYEWRGWCNEDTDLSLQALKGGWCTALFRALLMNKAPTMKMKGGNTDTLYDTDDHRRGVSEALRDQHPDVVDVVCKFNRWHHHVDYSRFRNNKLQLREGVVPTEAQNNYGLELVRNKKHK